MKNKPKVDNKWVDKRVKEFTDNIKNANILSMFSYDQKNNSVNFVLDFRSHLIKLVTQTQQDTLEWCLNEVDKCIPIKSGTWIEAEGLKQTIKKKMT